MLPRSLAVLLFIVLSGSVHSQTQYSAWGATFNTFKISEKTGIHSDFQWRSTDELTHMQTLLLRVGLNYSLRKNIILTAGYAFTDNRRLVAGLSGYAPEHRAWEQLIVNHEGGPVRISHRLRLEQRFIGQLAPENDKLVNDGYRNANRIRYFIRNILPLRQTPVFEKGMFAALQNEVFLNLGNKDAVNGHTFDQNRLYLALGYRLSSKVDLEAGYVNQYTKMASGRTNNHVTQLALYLRL